MQVLLYQVPTAASKKTDSTTTQHHHSQVTMYQLLHGENKGMTEQYHHCSQVTMYQALHWESKGTTHTTTSLHLSMGMLPMLKWVFENHCYWKTERWRNLEKKNPLQQEKKKIQESFHSFFFDENMSKIKFAKQENSESLAPHTELTYPFFHCLHNIDIVRNVHKTDVAAPHKNQWHMLLTSLSIHHRNKKHSCL